MGRIYFVNDPNCKRAQINGFTPTDDELQEIDAFLAQHPTADLRLIWFKEDTDMTFVKKLNNVKHLNVDCCQRDDFSFIQAFGGLKKLIFMENSGKFSIDFMQNLTELEDLQFDTSKSGKTHDLKCINGLKSLEVLLFKGRFKKKSLILDFPKLKAFAPKLEYINLNEIGKLDHLKTIHLLSQKTDNLNFITQIPSLTGVGIDSLQVEHLNHLAAVFDLPHLEALSISSVRRMEDFTFVKPCPSLKKLIIYSLNDLLSLNGIERLENIENYIQWGKHQHRNEIDFQALTKLKHLKELSVKVGTMSQEAEKRLIQTLEQVKILK